MTKTVWVLGAGFSKPLGGPLLNDLFSRSNRERIQVEWADEPTLQGEQITPVYQFFNVGHEYSQGKEGEARSNGFRWWQHAEDFIQQLDSAKSVKRHKHLERLYSYALHDMIGRRGPSTLPKDFALRARHIIAAECSLFLQGVDSDEIRESEQWMPFVKWGRQLMNQSEANSIITFNYDRVLEMLCGVGVDFEVGLGNGWQDTGVRVHKLHGSVNWRLDPTNGTLRTEEEFALQGEASQLAIATPGPTKKSLVNAAFLGLWSDALEKLAKANRIIFVGFGFPDSDSYVLEKLMGAISSAPSPSMEVVLGPIRNSPPIARLEALLEHQAVLNGGKVKIHPMYGQDFLTLGDY